MKHSLSHSTFNHKHCASTQNGSVLLISLVILLVLTIVGVSAMRNTTLEEKMAGNMRDKGLSFQAAEATLRALGPCRGGQITSARFRT